MPLTHLTRLTCVRFAASVILLLAVAACPLRAGEGLAREEAARALRRAVTFFETNVSAEGGYLWRYSADLKQREGEGRAGPLTAWVQPPGTPTVGQAYLEAWQLTGEEYLLQAARRTALALVKGQLRSGGWDYRIEFAPKLRRRYAYRRGGDTDGRNVTTLDDDTTQSAARFLMRLDRALEFRDEPVHEAARYALDSLLKAQYPNGAWPQRFSEFPEADEFPVKKAGYPESWPRKHPGKDYRGYYTFNDNTIADVIEVMFDAAEIYGEDRFRAAAGKAGGFILLAQMPHPQPGWAQQYNRQMHPAWARRFEPPAITGGESQGVMRTLLELYRRTGEKKYLEPLPRALAYYRKSLLPDGRLARFYELKTNRPLYFTKKYELTYESDDLPTHYAFIVGSRLDSIEAEYRRLLKSGPEKRKRVLPPEKPRMTRSLAARARAAIEKMDERGAWLERGRLRSSDGDAHIITTRTLVKNIGVLSRFVAAAQE